MVTDNELFKRTTIRSIERYVQESVGNDFLTTVTDRQYIGGPQDFLNEIRRKNSVTKLIPYIPRGLKLGVSRLFVAYFYTREIKPAKILGYFIAEGVDVIVPDNDIDSYREIASDPNVALIPVQYDTALRREPGTIWVTNRHRSAKMEIDQSQNPELFDEVIGGFAMLRIPIEYDGDYFRSIAHFAPSNYDINLSSKPLSREAIEDRARRILNIT